MAKRKQSSQPLLSAEAVSRIGIGVIVFITLFFVVAGILSFGRQSDLFAVKDVLIPENLQSFALPDVAKLKGQNIFQIDLAALEKKVRQKYPQLANLRVIKRFPDRIEFSAFKRDAFALVAPDGRLSLIDKEGFSIGAPSKDTEPFPLIKGLVKQKLIPGDALGDGRVKIGIEIIKVFREDRLLSKVPLRSVDVGDMARIVCVLGEEGDTFEVLLDKDNFARKAGGLATLISRNDVDLLKVKYIDLRFEEPLVGQKKTVKK
jgi:hypothetical protein